MNSKPMRILIDLLHPAHVHFFRHFHTEMLSRGHDLRVVARAKDCTLDLLDAFEVPYTRISTQASGSLGLLNELLYRTYRLMRIAKAFHPDVMTGIMGPSIALAGRLLGVPAVVFYDTEFAVQTNFFAYPLAHSVCTPDCYQGVVRGNHRMYAGYHELAYLHPNRFTPDRAKLSKFGINGDEPYSIVRFVSWQAIHDRRERGLSLEQKRRVVERLERHGRVVISSEGPLPDELLDRRVAGPPEDIHHLIAYAQLILGESATMASEAAILGVPAVFIAKTGRGYISDQERRYGLVHHFTHDQLDYALSVTDELLRNSGPHNLRRARERLLAEKIDVTDWMVRYFERDLH